MKKTFLIAAVALISTVNLFAQQDSTINPLQKKDYSNKFDLKVGSGFGFMGWGDLIVVCFENEFNYKIYKYFTFSAGFGIGRSIGGNDRRSVDYRRERHNDYLSGSINAFVSPFRNNRRNNFRIGGGYTYINETSASTYYHLNDTEYDIEYTNAQMSSHCFNVIIEDEFKITTRLMIGAKFSLIGNIDSAIMWNGLIKFGVVL